MKRNMIVAVVVAVLATAVQVSAAPLSGVIDVTSFAEHVKDPGTETEDWQPAFQKAIEAAQQELKALYVPAGEYKIRQTIVIVPVIQKVTRSGGHRGLRIFGDGQGVSVISQQVETENVIDWTGLKYEESANGGHLSNIGLKGGKTALNIKWHNYFMMDYVYIHGPMEYGVYAEGWASRVLNSTIRWCRKAGIRAGGHFNNCIIRDCYFSRDVVGFRIAAGAYGSRIEGCAFEVCSKAAIYLHGCRDFTISNSYFEGNAYKDTALLPVEGSADTIRLDYSCWRVSIHDNIFRANLDEEGAFIALAYCVKGHIYDNSFLGANNGIKLRSTCEQNLPFGPHVALLVVENNFAKDVTNMLAEEEPGLIEKALSRNCAFRIARKRICEGSPIGQERPEAFGDEILDTESNTWYKAVGPKNTDWVSLN